MDAVSTPKLESLARCLTPLQPEEYAALEASILKEGCRHPLIVWKGILVDGHNRYEICNKHGKPYKTSELPYCETQQDVLVWIIDHQLARRNISEYDRGVLALKKKGIISARAKAKQQSGSNQHSSLSANSPEPSIDTREEVAKAAGIGSNTLSKIEKIDKIAAPAVKHAVRRGDISINAAAKLAKLPQDEQKSIAEGGVTALKQAAKTIPNKRTSTAPADARPAQEVVDDGNIVDALQAEIKSLRATVQQQTMDLDLQHAENGRLREKMDEMRVEIARLNAELGHTAQLVLPQVQLSGALMQSCDGGSIGRLHS